jgi:hypothetical protein
VLGFDVALFSVGPLVFELLKDDCGVLFGVVVVFEDELSKVWFV